MNEKDLIKFEDKINRLDDQFQEFYYRISTTDREHIYCYYQRLVGQRGLGDLSAVELAVALGRYLYKARLEELLLKIPRKHWSKLGELREWRN